MAGKKSREIFKEQLNHMVSTIRTKIMTGEMAIGDYLPSELFLADQYGLSKNSVRRGLAELVEEGLILKQPRVGNQVVSDQPFEKKVLRIGYYPSLINEVHFTDLVGKFEEKHPNVKVRLVALPYDNYREVVRDLFLNDMLDAVSINYKDFQELSGDEELLEEMDYKEEIYPFLQTPFQVDKRQYVMPFVFSPIVLCYNKEHFDQKNMAYPDSGWTWNDALAAADVLMKDKEDEKVCGLYFHPLSMNRWPLFMLQNGVTFQRGSDGEIIFPKAAMLESINMISHTFQRQGLLQTFLSDSNKDAEQLFVEGKTSMIAASYFILNEISRHDIKYDIAPLPYMQDPKTFLLIIGMAVNKHASGKQTAKLFAEFMAGDEAQEAVRIHTLSLPVLKRATVKTGREKVYKPSRYQLFREIIPSYSLFTDLGLDSQELTEIRNEMRFYLSELIDERQFLENVEKKLSRKVAKMKT